MHYIPIELEDNIYNLVTDVEGIEWDGKEGEDDTKGYYKADVLYFVMKDGSYLAAFKDDFDNETRQYINQFVDPI